MNLQKSSYKETSYAEPFYRNFNDIFIIIWSFLDINPRYACKSRKNDNEIMVYNTFWGRT